MESLMIASFGKPAPPSLSFLPVPGSNVAANCLKCKVFSNMGRLKPWPNLMYQHVKSTGHIRVTLNPRNRSKYIANSTGEHSLECEPSQYPWRSARLALDAFYRFSRPHTIIGTALSIISISLLAVQNLSDFSPIFFTGVLVAIVAALLMNVYIVGLNQLFDVEIDKVNKPHLPVASGEYSFTTGVAIVSSSAILSFWLSWIVGSRPLFWALFVGFILGSAYSIDLPFLRWKRFALLAAMCIFTVRAVVVQIAFYLHVQMHLYGRPAALAKPVIFAIAFMSFFSVVIALFKDIPDIVGDRIYGVQSLTVRLGQERVFWICISLLEMAYAIAFFVGATSSLGWSKWTTVSGHTVLGFLLWIRAKSVDLNDKASVTSFSMFIWKLFYAEYILIPFVR